MMITEDQPKKGKSLWRIAKRVLLDVLTLGLAASVDVGLLDGLLYRVVAAAVSEPAAEPKPSGL